MVKGIQIISIVIITKDTKELLKALLQSVMHDGLLQPYLKEIIIIDNASTDGTAEMTKSEFSGATLVRNDENRGFSVSANQGIAHSTGEYVLLLNSDTLMIEGEILKMLTFMDEQRDTGICGPQLVYPDMKPQRSFAYRPTLLLEVIPKPILELMFPTRYARSNLTYSAPIEVDSLIGAAIMVRRKALELTGGFDERFFFFLEETDLCLRIREEGQRIIFFPDARVIHLQGRTVGQSWIEGRIEYNISLHKFIKKHHTSLYYFTFSFIRFLKCFLMLVSYSVLPFLLITGRAWMKYKYYFRLLVWHMRGRPEKGGLRISFPIQKLLQE
jgi:GT2 family glycosyltransferase